MTRIHENPFFHAHLKPARTPKPANSAAVSPDTREPLPRLPSGTAHDVFTPSSSRAVAHRPLAPQPSLGDSLRSAFRLDEDGGSLPSTPSTSRQSATFTTVASGPFDSGPLPLPPQNPDADAQPSPDPVSTDARAAQHTRGRFDRIRNALTSLAQARNRPTAPAAQQPAVHTGKARLRQMRHEGTMRDHLTRAVLSDLPGLLRLQGGERNEAIVRHAEALLVTLPEEDHRRIETVRTAAAFLDPTDEASHSEAVRQLAHSALGTQRASIATQEQLDAVLGTEAERRTAVVGTMPEWLAHVPAPIVATVIDQLPPAIANGEGPHHLREQATRYVAARDGHPADRPARLPDGWKWLDSGYRQGLVINGYRSRLAQSSNRFLPMQIAKQAADLKALKSVPGTFMNHDLRPDFLRFVERLFDAREHRDGPSLVYSRDRLRILQNLLQQPMTDSGPLQNQVLALVRGQMRGNGLTQRDRTELVKTLARMAPNYNNSRVAALDHQRPAIDGVSAGLRNLPASRTAEALTEVMHQMPNLSTHRSAAGDQPSSLGPLGLAGYVARQAAGGFMTWGLFNAGSWLANAVGSRSPASQGMHVIDQAIARHLRLGAEADTAESMLPVVRQLLNQPPQVSSTRIGKQLHRKALAGLVRGGLPFGLPQERRAALIDAGIGDDAARRTDIAKELQTVANGEGIGRKHPVTRQAAARYLHHLLQAGNHQLSAAEVEQAKAAIQRAFRSNVRGQDALDASTVMGALLSEIPRSGPRRDEALTAELSRRIMSGLANYDALAEAIGPIAAAFEGLSPTNQREVVATALSRVPEHPAQRGDAARPQRLPLKAIVALAGFVGEDSTPVIRSLMLPLFERMNRDYRDATFNQLFDAYAEAPPTGQRAVVNFIGQLQSPGEFVNGLRQFARRALADETVRDSIDRTAYENGVGMLNTRLPGLDPEQLSAAVRSVVEGNPDLPVPVLEILLSQAHRADPASLRELMANVVNSLPTREPDETDRLKAALGRLSRQLQDDPERRGTVHAFMKVADLRPRRPESIIQPSEAEHLASQLPGMNATLARATLGDIADVHLPEPASNAVIESLLNGYARFPAEGRQEVLKYTYPKSPRLTLHALASRVGTPEFVNGKPVRPAMSDQHVPQPQGGEAPLHEALLQQPADVVQSALEALTEKVFGVPGAHRGEILDVLTQRGFTLPRAHQLRLAETLVLAEGRQLSDDEIRSVGGDPAHPIWRFPEQTKLHERKDRLKALRSSRLQDPASWPRESAALAPRGAALPFVRPEGPANVDATENRRHTGIHLHRRSQHGRGSISSGESGNA